MYKPVTGQPEIVRPQVISTECIKVNYTSDINAEVIDMLDWVVMDATLRNNYVMSPGPIATLVFGNYIVNTKFDLVKGDNWDVWTFDDDYIYFFLTGDSQNYTRNPDKQVPYTPRFIQVGNPGVQVVNHCNKWQTITNCVPGSINPGANIITEVWGPFNYTFAGNIGNQNVMSIKYYWNCSGDTPSTCTELEENWYVRPYGWVQWAHSSNPNREEGGFSFPPHYEPFDSIIPGVTNFVTWCESN
jgi:hypothetical protein